MSRNRMNNCLYSSYHQFTGEYDKEEHGEKKPRRKVGLKKVTLFIVVIFLAIVLLFVFLQLGSSLYKKPPDFDIYLEIERLNVDKNEDEKYVIEMLDWNVIKIQADAVGIVSIEMDSWNEFKESIRQHEFFVRALGLDEMQGIVWFIDGPIFYYQYK